MTNIFWPRNPALCNRDGRVCIRLEEVHYEVLMHDQKVGDFYFTGEHSIVLLPPGIPGLTLRKVNL